MKGLNYLSEAHIVTKLILFLSLSLKDLVLEMKMVL